MTETIEGTAVEIPEQRAVVVSQPGQALIVEAKSGPADMIDTATRIATALVDIVERQNLYSVISGKKFPKVEAWMTIGRMDNVVAREAEPPVRNEDGSFEAFVELVRLSDGMVIGRASALCGTPDDRPWNGRAMPARRAMAVTRATSRAFRQQYSWIMALAGYEPTPSEEMPHDEPAGDFSNSAYGHDEPPKKVVPDVETEELVGDMAATGMVRNGGAEGYKLEPRQGPDGHVIGFRMEFKDDKAIPQVVVDGPAGEALFLATSGNPGALVDTRLHVKGRLFNVKRPRRQSFKRLHVTEWESHDWAFPAKQFSDEEQARLDQAVGAA